MVNIIAMSDTLLLNSGGQPISSFPVSTISWQRAVKLHFLQKVTVLEWYDDWEISSPSFSMNVPATVMVKEYQKVRHNVRFCRYNLALRDEFKCGYCGEQYQGLDGLTVDHIVPRSKGGKTHWTNCVIACHRCNVEKGSNLWTPRKKPEAPDYYRMAALRSRIPFFVKHKSWLDYLPNGVEKSTVT